MKRTLITLICICFVSTSLFAQRRASGLEVNISGGGPDIMFGAVGISAAHYSMIGEVRYTPEKWVSFGLIGGAHDRVHNGKTQFECNLMAMIYGNWYTGESIKIYSGVGYGTIAGATDGYGRQAHGVQITPVGVSFGKDIFGFTELGVGWMFALARAGIGYRF